MEFTPPFASKVITGRETESLVVSRGFVQSVMTLYSSLSETKLAAMSESENVSHLRMGF